MATLSTPAVPFSYAAAAKGLTSSNASNTSKVTSGAVTPAKDIGTIPSLASEIPAGKSGSWADDAENEAVEKDNHSSATTAVDAQSSPRIRSPITHASTFVANGVTGPSSPEFGASSTSTLAREDDEKSNPTSLSETAWENKSQASVTEKPVESTEITPSNKGRGRKGDDSRRKGKGEKKGSEKHEAPKVFPVLTEAPIPSVNIWAMRAQEAKAKPAVRPVSAPQPQVAESEAKPKATQSKPVQPSGEKKPAVVNGEVAKSVEKPEGRTTGDDWSSRRGPREGVKGSEKVERAPKAAPPPKDPQSWPTPDLVKEEEAKKTHEKHEKSEKEQEDCVTTPASKVKKPAWTALEFTPSVNFKTPLPGSNPRKGGRGESGRGDRSKDSKPRGSGDKGSPTNAESSRRTRTDGAARNASPAKAKRAGSTEPSARKESRPVNGAKETTAKETVVVAEPQTLEIKYPLVEEDAKQTSNQHNTFPRAKDPSKQKQGRRTDLPFVNGETRRENESNTKDIEAAAGHRRTSSSGQGEDAIDRRASAPSENGSKFHTAERRNGNGSYSSFSNGDSMRGRGRGSNRGSRSGINGFHNSGNHYGNSQIAAIPPFGMPRSPTGQQQDPFAFQHHYQQRMPYRGQQNRASTIPTENPYMRLQNGYPGALPPLNTYVQGGNMYDHNAQGSMSAMPFHSPVVDTYQLIGMVSQQIEYYFSVNNLCKDVYLRKHMDSQGFVLLSVVANFKRMRQLTSDVELIKLVCRDSNNLEYLISTDDHLDRLRLRVDWDKWVFPMADRDPSAQNDGPSGTYVPPTPSPMIFDRTTMRQTSLPLAGSPTPASAPPFQSLNGFASAFNAFTPANKNDVQAPTNFHSIPNGFTTDSHMVNSPENSHVTPSVNGTPMTNGAAEHTADSFTDGQAEELMVVVRRQDIEAAAPPAPIRTFSNGSLDGRNIAEELGVPLNGPTAVSAGPHESEARASPAPRDLFVPPFLAGGRKSSRRNLSRSSAASDAPKTTETNIYWVKDQNSPASELPPDTTSVLYIELRAKALSERAQQTPFGCPYDMHVLYQFWSHFLIRNFNFNMYNEFRTLALDDVQRANSCVGRRNILKYYSGALAHQDPIRPVVAQDYINLVMAESRESDRIAFKQLRTAWRDGALNMKNRKRIMDIIDPALAAELDGTTA